MNFLITLSCCKADAPQCAQLIKWIKELGGVGDFDLLLSWTPGAAAAIDVDEMTSDARSAFRDVHVHKLTEEVLPRKLKDDRRDWTPNNVMFRRVAEYVNYLLKDVDAFYFMEPDVIPLVSGWADKLKAAYVAGGKPFFGARRPTRSDSGEDRGTHMNGSGVYPRTLHVLTPSSLTVTNLSPDKSVPWDVAATNDVQPHFQDTNLIFVGLTKEPIPLGSVPPYAILYHGDKTGSLIPQLRDRFTPKPVKPGPLAAIPTTIITTTGPIPYDCGVVLPPLGTEIMPESIQSLISKLKVIADSSPSKRIEVRAALTGAGIIPKRHLMNN